MISANFIVLPAVSGTFAISTYSPKHEILTAANVLKLSVPSTLKLACIGLACILSVGPAPEHFGNGVLRFRKQAWEREQQRSACYHLTPTVTQTQYKYYYTLGIWPWVQIDLEEGNVYKM